MTIEEVNQMLSLSEKGWPYNTIDNAVIILKNDPLFAGNIRDNLFRERIELSGKMPWSRAYVDVTDKDDIHIRHYIEKYYRFRNDKAVRDAMQIVATENEYHPVREYLDSLIWDGVERVKYALPHFARVAMKMPCLHGHLRSTATPLET